MHGPRVMTVPQRAGNPLSGAAGMTISIIGLDLGKSVFQVHGVDVHGR